MVITTKTLFVLGALAVSAQFTPSAAASPAGVAAAGAPIVAADVDLQPGNAEKVDKQNYAPKLSPQDMKFDQHKIDDEEKFSAPKKAPNDKQVNAHGDEGLDSSSVPAQTEEDSLASSGSKGSKILDDYDPNRLGVSADEAKTGKEAKEGKIAGNSKNDAAKNDENDKKNKGKQQGALGSQGAQVSYGAQSRSITLLPPSETQNPALGRKLSKEGYMEPKKSVPWAADGAPVAPASATSGPAFHRINGVEKYYSNSAPLVAPLSNAAVGVSHSVAHQGVPGYPATTAAAGAATTTGVATAGAVIANTVKIMTPTTTATSVLFSTPTYTGAHADVGLKGAAQAGIASENVDAKAQKQEAAQLQQSSEHIEEVKGTSTKDKAIEDAVLASEHSLGKLIGAALMIVTSEIGDKTFFIAALMAMKHPHLFVFSSSYSAMVVMTVLSMVLGLILPSLLSKRVTTLLAALLFLVFGYRLLREGLHMDRSVAATDELEDVEQDLEMHESTLASEKAEGGGSTRAQTATGTLKEYMSGMANLAALILSPVWIQIFAMTFFGEWGDRSQIATVAMGTGNGWGEVLVGCLLGHFITTVIAVVGGKILAQHLSLRSITLSGAACFLLFAVIYFNDWLNQ